MRALKIALVVALVLLIPLGSFAITGGSLGGRITTGSCEDRLDGEGTFGVSSLTGQAFLSGGQWLSNPVWKGATEAGVTVSAIPKVTGNYRLAYGTTSGALSTIQTNCYRDRRLISDPLDSDGLCDVTSGDRVDFVLTTLNEDTRYYYHVQKETPTGSGNWASLPEAHFLTLTGTATDVQHFALVGDEHSTQHYSTTECGNPSDPDFEHYNRLIKTFSNILEKNVTRNYRAYISEGDTFQLHSTVQEDHDCVVVNGQSAGGCGINSTCDVDSFGSIQSQAEADARMLLGIQIFQPVLAYLPFVWTRGNHDPSLGMYEEDHGTAINFAENEHWYIDASNNMNLFAENAYAKTLPNPAFTYNGTEGEGDVHGQYYSFASGSVEFIFWCVECGIGENLDGDGTPREAPDDFPGNVDGWNDWNPGPAQCTYLTGSSDCTGTSGRIRATTWDDTLGAGGDSLSLTFKIVNQHHTAGSSKFRLAEKDYGRGGMGAVERFCTGDGTTQCSNNSNCTGLGVCPAYLGTEPMNGWQDELQREHEAFLTAVGGNAGTCNIQGHDHNANFGIKHDSGGSTGVCYISMPQPSHRQEGPTWTNNNKHEATQNWGGINNNIVDLQPDYCTTASRTAFTFFGDNTTACTSDDNTDVGSTLRGYVDLEINGTTNYTVSQILTVTPADEAAGIGTNLDTIWTVTVP